ncbi:MAG: bifunctional nuclease domain-containing protein [Flavobacteriales bacterium]
MKKINLDIIGLSYSQTQTGAYALVLGERNGKRRLPIIIGGFEAQAIAIELEKMTPSRPLTHDLFKTFATTFDIEIKEVVIYNLVEGIFFAKLVCEKDGKEVEIDARTSDSIALAVRFNCPISTFEFILSSAGILLEDEQLNDEDGGDNEDDDDADLDDPVEELLEPSTKDITTLNASELEKYLEDAIAMEDYERASQIRDELSKRKKS